MQLLRDIPRPASYDATNGHAIGASSLLYLRSMYGTSMHSLELNQDREKRTSLGQTMEADKRERLRNAFVSARMVPFSSTAVSGSCRWPD